MNTVDGWFKRLETDRIHYINRSEDTNEKIYDDLDLKIAIFIKSRREDKWSLAAISRDLQNHFDLRPFPKTESTFPSSYVEDIESIKQHLSIEMRASFEELAATKIEELKNQYESIIKQLPQPISVEEQKEQRFQDMVLRKRIENKLEDEALKLWSTKPESERTKRVGFFRTEEDYDKKYRFIKDYVNNNFEITLKEELDL
ncbi:MerR family transcriptional regulator [Bacillus idriensis]|uniref:MerR family transcriptional regulator n=2 Tax=Metabacillus idriensis TaxID=324768 RepID=A0A6I2ML39_9BACI|nr:MerR family transcriptional regulator [Metabacillus idriensis]